MWKLKDTIQSLERVIFLLRTFHCPVTNMVLKMRQSDGTFTDSISDNKGSNGRKDYLATYMALYVLHTINPDYNMEYVKIWIEKAFQDEFISSSSIFDKVANIKNLVDIAKIVEPKLLVKFNNELVALLNDYQKHIMVKYDKSYPINILSTLIELANDLNYKIKISPNTIFNIVNQYKSEDGGFSFFINDKSNALSTYLAIQMLQDNSQFTIRNGKKGSTPKLVLEQSASLC
ncbi:hypothetical protein [Paenibacillus caui]|uniref:hypothetical protein n=1 Tax=Paenibacillus caui TaxID=2873927 RepID=UPI001CA9FBE5|nr:hypothetical protein [Paenibacillus caui]